MGPTVRRLAPTALLIAVLLSGTGLRLARPIPTSTANVSAASLALAGALGAEDRIALQGLVTDFCRLMEAGAYEQIAERVIEFEWQWNDEGAPIKAIAVRDPVAFADFSRGELGPGRSAFILVQLTVDEPAALAGDLAELAEYRRLAGANAYLQAAAVPASGTVRIGCSVYEWGRTFIAIQDSQGWKLVLPQPASSHRLARMLAWFPQVGGFSEGERRE
ncbi:MAG: hypothetical protein V1772_11130 [Chloroflexota bacterium]